MRNLVLVISVFFVLVSSVMANDDDILLENRINMENSTVQFSQQELAWIKANPTVTVIGDADWLPFEGFDETGRYLGIVSDILNLITSKSGLDFDINETASWQHSLQFSSDKQVDVISASASNPIIEKNYRSTYSTIQSPLVIVARNTMQYVPSLGDSKGLRVGLITTAGYNHQVIEAYPDIEFVNIDSIREGLLGVAENDYDLVLMSLMLANYKMAELNLYELHVAGITDLDMELTLFVNRNKPLLWSIIDKVKRHESKQERHQVLSKWVKYKYIERFSPAMMNIIIGGLLLLLSGFFYRHYLVRKQAKKLLTLSQTDRLTKIPNRLYIQQVLQQKVEKNQLDKSELSIIMVDLDHLKLVNDKHGYLAGDKLLQQFALLLDEHVDSDDIVGRWAGGEFVVICPQKNRQQARNLAEKLRSEVDHAIFLGVGKKTASLGVAQYQFPESAETFLGRADKTLYYAKGSGRNKVKTEF